MHKRLLLLWLALLVCLCPIAGNAVVHTVNMSGFSFSPLKTQVSPGDTVKWMNLSGVHTSETLPTAAKVWNSGTMAAGDSFMVVFNAVDFPGPWPYYCLFHQDLGMVDTIFPAPAVPGACCLPNGSCIQATSVDCATQQGVYHGDGVPCTQVDCQALGACCLPTGACVQLTEAECLLNGTFQGVGVTCAQANCTPPRGACCIPGALCQILTAADCANAGGTYQGDNTSCTPDPCTTPQGRLLCSGCGRYAYVHDPEPGGLRGRERLISGGQHDLYARPVCSSEWSLLYCWSRRIDLYNYQPDQLYRT